MRKVFSIAAAFLVTLSISGCAVGHNGGTGVRRLSEQNYINNTNTNYRDGVYTGYSDAHANTMEMAVVEIRNGRIANVILGNVNQQGGIGNTTGTGINNQAGTGVGPNNQGMPNKGMGNVMTPGIGNTTGMGSSNPGGINSVTGTGNIGGTGTNNNGITYGNTTGTGNPAGTRNTTLAGNGTNRIGGTAADGTVGTALDRARTNMVNMMIQNQRYDVNIANNDTGLAGTISNWKLAISRALAQAQR